MTRHVWTALRTLVLVCCLLGTARARSASTSYQHANGLAAGQELTAQRKDPTQAAPSYQAEAGGSSHSAGSASSPTVWKDLSLMFRIYQQCSSENLSVCLKVKLLTGLEKAFRTSKALKLVEGVQFVKGEETARAATADQERPVLSEKDIEAVLPRGLDAKEHVLNNMIIKKLAAFLQDYTLQVRFPDLRALNHGASDGRGKKDKKGGGAYIMIPLLLGGTFIPIAYGALAMLAGKALIVSKLALVLASIIGIKKLIGGGGAKESQHEVVVSGGHSGWGRDFDLAYSGWKPAKDAAKVM